MKKLLIMSTILSFLGCLTAQKDLLTYQEVKSGNNLEKAEELSVNDFFDIWMSRTLPVKANIPFQEVYQDTTYTYFFEQVNLGKKNYLGKTYKGSILFKVTTKKLDTEFRFYNRFDPMEISGVNIKKEVAKTLGLKEQYDKDHLNNAKFNYRLLPNSIIEITLDYKNTLKTVICKYGSRFYNKVNLGLERLIQKQPKLIEFVLKLKSSDRTYHICEDCNFFGLNENKIIGHSDRIRPTGNYFKKELEIGSFNYDVFQVYDFSDARVNIMYVCYFNKKQKDKFKDFFKYYNNFIGHGKGDATMKIIENNIIIHTSHF